MPAQETKAVQPKEEKVVYQPTADFPDLMASVIKKIAKASRIVKKMWLLDRVAGKPDGYLILVDSDQNIAELKEEMTEAAQDYLEEGVLEIRPFDGKDAELIEGIKPFYKKGFFG